MSVTVVRNRYVKGWPRHEQGEHAEVVELSAALLRPWPDDHHFAAYRAPNQRRLVAEAIDQLGGVEMTAVVFDVDCSAVHGSNDPAPESWRAALRGKLHVLALVHERPYYYETRGGARIVYRLQEPDVLRSQDDAARWSTQIVVAVAYLANRFGIEADAACCDWQRLYRLPRSTRGPGGKPEDWATIGDANNIGTLQIRASRDDVKMARLRSPATFRSHRKLDFTSCAGDGRGVFFHLLRRNHLVRERGDGSYIIRCPNEVQHTTRDKRGTATILYPPAHGKHLGAIHCKHAHCSGKDSRDWLALFSPWEIEEAERAATGGRDGLR